MNQNYCVSRRMVVAMPLEMGKDLEGLDTVSWAHLSIVSFEIALQNGYWAEFSFYSSWAILHLSLPCSVFLGDVFLKNCILFFWLHFGFGQWEKLTGDLERLMRSRYLFPISSKYTYSANRLSVATALLHCLSLRVLGLFWLLVTTLSYCYFRHPVASPKMVLQTLLSFLNCDHTFVNSSFY